MIVSGEKFRRVYRYGQELYRRDEHRIKVHVARWLFSQYKWPHGEEPTKYDVKWIRDELGLVQGAEIHVGG